MSLSKMDKRTKRLLAELAEFGILPEKPHGSASNMIKEK